MIRLEHFMKEDFKQLISWVDSETLLTHWSGSLFRFPLNEDSLDWYIEDSNNLANSEAFIYKAVDNETGETVGHISLGGLSFKNRSARVSRVLVGNSQDRKAGICQQMVKAILKIGFEDLHLHRISLGVYTNNPAAIRCYERCGFINEGINRDILLHNNEWWSMIEMSMLEDEWRLLAG